MINSNSTQVWLQIATELQELSGLLNPAESTKLESRQLRQNYKRRLIALKEQAIRNSLKD